MLSFIIEVLFLPLMNLRSISKPVGQLSILVYLFRNEKASAKVIMYRIGLFPKTATSALSNLVDLKLVRELKDENYKLTKKGKDVAEHLDQIEKFLS